jgi:ketosteroid isomerase-like protein
MAEAERLTPAAPPGAAKALSAAINAGDLDRAIECFSVDGAIVTPDATTVHGREKIRPILAQMIARRTSVEAATVGVRMAGSVALVSERWNLRTPGPESAIHESRSDPLLALRLLHDGWKVIHASPWRRGEGSG